MILFKLLLLVPSVFALSGQQVSLQGCQDILPEFIAQREICFTQLARNTGDRTYCAYVPSNEGAARCEAFVLSLKRPSWTLFVDNGWFVYLTTFAVLTLIITTERREFLFGLILGVFLYLVFHFIKVYIPNSGWIETVKQYADIAPRSVTENAPGWFTAQNQFTKEIVAYLLSYGQLFGHLLGATLRHAITGVVLFALCIAITLYGAEAYAFVAQYLS